MERGDELPQFENLVRFLKVLNDANLLKKEHRESNVVYADD